jgi:hypothetical protein
MLGVGIRSQPAEPPGSVAPLRPASTLGDLFLPLPYLLGCGGDPRLGIDPASGANQYGCRPQPCPGTPSFSSSTATSISEPAYERAGAARESLMRSAIAAGLDEAFEARVEAMREELKVCLGLPPGKVDVVFSPSGTDSQLQAVLLARALLGPRLTTVVVAADQTGSGTADTARGHHFSAATANGIRVRKGEPVAGLAHGLNSVALPLLDPAGDFRQPDEIDSLVLGAIEAAVANGPSVLLQIMDSSKLGWRAPSDQCLDEIEMRWPDRVQVVVDACQMRLGRPRLRKYLDRGYMVIVTGSKFFTGPAFSGALLVPAGASKALDAVTGFAPGLCDYFSRSDWPKNWPGLRSRFPARANVGQWLRWEAALEEIRTYYDVPGEFRLTALTMFGQGVQRIIAASPSPRLLPPQRRPTAGCGDDEELAQPTIFPFLIERAGRALALDDCSRIYRLLSSDARHSASANEGGRDREAAAKACLVGQPVALGDRARHPAAALRICADARLVRQAWSSNQQAARANLERELERVAAIVAKIEWLLAQGAASPAR